MAFNQNPYANAYTTPKSRGGIISVIFAVVFALATLGLIVWTVLLVSENSVAKDEYLIKETAATEPAKKSQFNEDLATYLGEQNKTTRRYQGSSDFGNLSFDYPRDWGFYTDNLGDGKDGYSVYFGENGIVPPLSNPNSVFATSFKIINTDMSESKNEITNNDRENTISHDWITVFNDNHPVSVERYSGVPVDKNKSDKTYTEVLIPVRDKTLIFYLYSDAYSGQFYNTILKSLKWED